MQAQYLTCQQRIQSYILLYHTNPAMPTLLYTKRIQATVHHHKVKYVFKHKYGGYVKKSMFAHDV